LEKRFEKKLKPYRPPAPGTWEDVCNRFEVEMQALRRELGMRPNEPFTDRHKCPVQRKVVADG